MNQIIIVPASPQQVSALVSLSRETFYETFAPSNSEENMQQYLENNLTEDKLGSEMSNSNSVFYIAFEGETAIGYLKLNEGEAQTELQNEDSLEIERIYVKSEYHGKKVGQMLYDKAVEAAREKNKSSLWLGVWEENPKAIRFYEKNGFTAFGKHIFRMGTDEQTDIMMRKYL